MILLRQRRLTIKIDKDGSSLNSTSDGVVLLLFKNIVVRGAHSTMTVFNQDISNDADTGSEFVD